MGAVARIVGVGVVLEDRMFFHDATWL